MSDSNGFMPDVEPIIHDYSEEVSVFDLGTIEAPVRINRENAPHLMDLYSATIEEDKLFEAMVNAPLPRGWRFTRMEATRSQLSIDLVFCTNIVPDPQDFLAVVGAVRSQALKFKLIKATKDAARRRRAIDYHSRMRK